LDAHQLSPVTFGNDHGNQFMVLSAPHLVVFFYYCFAFFYHVTCVHISNIVLTETS